MCVVSVVHDYMMHVPPTQWDRPTFDEFRQIIDRLDALDRKLNQPECHDPAKAAWMEEVERRLKVLEAR